MEGKDDQVPLSGQDGTGSKVADAYPDRNKTKPEGRMSNFGVVVVLLLMVFVGVPTVVSLVAMIFSMWKSLLSGELWRALVN